MLNNRPYNYLLRVENGPKLKQSESELRFVQFTIIVLTGPRVPLPIGNAGLHLAVLLFSRNSLGPSFGRELSRGFTD